MDFSIRIHIPTGAEYDLPLTRFQNHIRNDPLSGLRGIIGKTPAGQIHRIVQRVVQLYPVREPVKGIFQEQLIGSHDLADANTTHVGSAVKQKQAATLRRIFKSGGNQIGGFPLTVRRDGRGHIFVGISTQEFHDLSLPVFQNQRFFTEPGKAKGCYFGVADLIRAIYREIPAGGNHCIFREYIFIVAGIVRQDVSGQIHRLAAVVVQLYPVAENLVLCQIAGIRSGKL